MSIKGSRSNCSIILRYIFVYPAFFIGIIIINCVLTGQAYAFDHGYADGSENPGSGAETIVAVDVRDKGPAPPARLRYSIVAEDLKYNSLDKTYEFNPASDLMQPSSSGWEHWWREKRVLARIEYEAYRTERLLILPGLTLGAVQAEFYADNESLHFSEYWKTNTGLIWGVSVAGELRKEAGYGPFLWVRYGVMYAEADEDRETIRSTQPDTRGVNRDARFSWMETEALIGLGYEWKRIKLSGGGSYTALYLKKWLHYHIPEEGASPDNLDVIQALNSADSQYNFRNYSWAPYLELEWKLSPAWSLSQGIKFGTIQEFTFALRAGY